MSLMDAFPEEGIVSFGSKREVHLGFSISTRAQFRTAG